MSEKKVASRKRELKQKLMEIQDELHDLMCKFKDLELNVEVHMMIEHEHYVLDEFRLYSDEQIDDDDD